MKLTSLQKNTRGQSGISFVIIVIIIVVVLALIGVAWKAEQSIAYKSSEDNYKEAKKLLLSKKPKEAYAKLLKAKSYGLKKEGPAYYARLAGIALINGDKQAAKKNVEDGLSALKNYKKKDKDKIS